MFSLLSRHAFKAKRHHLNVFKRCLLVKCFNRISKLSIPFSIFSIEELVLKMSPMAESLFHLESNRLMRGTLLGMYPIEEVNRKWKSSLDKNVLIICGLTWPKIQFWYMFVFSFRIFLAILNQ